VVIAAAFFTRTVVVYVLPLTHRHTRTQRCPPAARRGCWGPTKLKNARTFLEHKKGCRCCHSSVTHSGGVQSFRLLLCDIDGHEPCPQRQPLPPDSPPPVSPAAQLAAQPVADCTESVGLCQYFTVSPFCSSMLNILLMLKRQFLFNVAFLARCATATSSGSRTFSMNPSRFHAAQDMAMQW
jgi:hypothetical protein